MEISSNSVIAGSCPTPVGVPPARNESASVPVVAAVKVSVTVSQPVKPCCRTETGVVTWDAPPPKATVR